MIFKHLRTVVFTCIFLQASTLSMAVEPVTVLARPLQEITLTEIRRIFGSTEMTFDNQMVLLSDTVNPPIKPDDTFSFEGGNVVPIRIGLIHDTALRLAVFVDGNLEPLVFIHEFGASSAIRGKKMHVLTADANFYSKSEDMCSHPTKRLVFVVKTVNQLKYSVTKPVRFLTNCE